MDHSAGTTFREWAELKALPEQTATDSSDRNLNIVWNILPHEPYFMGEDCQPRSTRLDTSREEVRRLGYTSLFAYQHALTARCTLLLVADYFDWLKAESVYDNTRIIVVSDHGIVGPVEDRSSRAVEGGTSDNLFVRSRSVLLVKEEGAQGALAVSEEFMPNPEVPRLACEQIDGCVNPYLADKEIAAHGRDSPFFVTFVPWQFNRQEPTAFVIDKELAVLGRNPYDASSWREVGRQ
jgi:hypothetical protein